MLVHWLYLFLLLWSFGKASIDSKEIPEVQKKKPETAYPTMAPNSKFLNPHLDDATNLQFAIAAFADDSKEAEINKSKASEILTKLSENWESNVSSREAKSLNEWKIFPFLNSLFRGNKNYRFKNV